MGRARKNDGAAWCNEPYLWSDRYREPTLDIREQLQETLSPTYTIEKELSGGGMSRVFLAEERSLGRKVVVKVLPHEMAAAVSIDRFKREISLAARLQHPHIVPLLTAGEVDGVPYFTMPYVEGESLRVRLARHGELPVAEGMRILREVASALAYAHGRGVVHRDIKPDNVLLSGGSAMMTDFGVAKALSASSNAEHSGVTSLGVALGTPAYMAPEQASADPALDHRADIYAFGILAYEVLTGQTPFIGRTPSGLLAAQVTEVPETITRRRANIPPALGALVMRCLEKRPADRPQTADEVLHALDDINTPSGGMQPTNAMPSIRVGAASKRNGILAGVAVVLVVAGIVALALRAGGPRNAAAAVPKSIAVLPIANVSGDTSMKFFAAGMTDELSAALAKIPGLRVASRSATDALQTVDVKTVGARLNVGAVLEARMRRDGDQMALTVQLTNAADGLSLWSDSYHAQVKDAFAVQDSVARAIASALKVALSPAQQATLVTQGTKSVKAHDLYLLGRYVQAEYTEPALRKSIQLFEQAIAEDSLYAAPFSGLVDSWGMLADDFISPREAVPKQREAIARGMAIDPENPALRNSVGLVALWYDRDIPKAIHEVEFALRADTTVQFGFEYYRIALQVAGLRDSALAVTRRWANNEDPAEAQGAATAAVDVGDSTLARSICARLQKREPTRCHTLLLAMDGRFDELLASYRDRERQQLGNERLLTGTRANIARLLVRMGRTPEAIAVANEIEQSHKGRYLREDLMAETWARIGDVDRTMSWLERAKKSNSSGITVIYVGWRDIPLRKEPRIAAFIRENAPGKAPPGW